MHPDGGSAFYMKYQYEFGQLSTSSITVGATGVLQQQLYSRGIVETELDIYWQWHEKVF